MAIRLSRRKIAGYIADQVMAGVDTNDLVRSIAAFLMDSRRTNELTLVIRDIEYQLAERGVILASVISAHKLSADVKKSITDMVSSQTGARSVQLQQFVDPGVIGGFKVDLPGRQLDRTVAHKLTQLRTNYKK